MQISPVRRCSSATACASAQLVGQRNFDLHVLARLHALDGLGSMQLRGRAENGGIDVRLRQRLSEFGRDVADTIFACDRARGLKFASDQGDDLDATDGLDGIQVLLAESAGAREDYFHVCILQNEVTDRRVRCGHVVEAVQATHSGLQRPAHDEPHHQFDPFRSGFAQILDMRHARQGVRILDQLVEPEVVPTPIDQAGTRTLQLMAHAARAPHLNIQILIEALDRATHGLAELEAAMPGGRRKQHHVDGERDDPHGPRARLTEHQR